MYCIKIYCLFLMVLTPPSDTVLIQAWLQQAKEQSSRQEYDSAEYYFKKAGTAAKAAHLPRQQIGYLQDYANFLFNRLRYTDALAISQEQLALSLEIQQLSSAASAYNNIAIQYRCLGQLQLAADNMIQALKISENLKDTANQRRYYSNLASIFLDLNDAKNSLLYAQKSHELASLLSDSLQVASSMVNLATAEMLNQQPDAAIKHLQQIIAIAGKLQHPALLLHAYVNLGDIYNKQGNYTTARIHYEKAAAMLKASPDADFEMYTNYGLANTYNHLNNPALALQYYDKALATAKTGMAKNDLKEVYLLGAEIQEKLHHPEAALQLWKQYSALKDTILNEHTQKTIQEAAVKYQTSLKEKALVQQQLQISNKNVQLQNKNRYILLSVILIILLTSTVLIGYLIYRNRHKLTALHLLKAQIHPHFLFNTLNNLYALSLQKSDESPGVVLELSQILRYILYECNTSTVSLEKEIKMIERYISLEKIRYENQLEINMDLDGDLSALNVAPLLILPLVENAFKHGISKLMEDGWINISAKARAGQFIFKISNNKRPGNNRQPSAMFGNIGLMNIRKRLHLLYPRQHELKIIDEDEVFIVILKINGLAGE